MSNNANEAAFPQTVTTMVVNESGLTGGIERLHKGLSKREAFAMAAMQGMCAGGYFNSGVVKGAEALGSDSEEAIAVAAVMMADRILKELDK